ncbi:hypothetical protein ACFFV7_45430 [Nonomuraea spiralis]|uniref:Uncharacterized protein n=1 Tax=Nonomuraea spiralis TaxID=46182 RepID=A0ABV5IV92_9ACTN|nr:hypothetical protein [Nonomuraea spiralis]GGS82939.1 hypothetical protein GCM10010176_028050 [Nonomuraea spiralis]
MPIRRPATSRTVAEAAGEAGVWELGSGRRLGSFGLGRGTPGVLTMITLPGGAEVPADARAGAVRLWRPATGEPLGAPPSLDATVLGMTAMDGTLFAATSRGPAAVTPGATIAAG